MGHEGGVMDDLTDPTHSLRDTIADGPVTAAALLPLLGFPRQAVAVVAHPDDEAFGLGAILAVRVDAGVTVDIVCLTHAEASTLGGDQDLGNRRQRELRAARMDAPS